jgi:hypothetical protein
VDNENYNWYELIDRTSGRLKNVIRETITEKSDENIAKLFSNLVLKRNRIIHSFQITFENEQILSTKDRQHRQFRITTGYLLKFIKENEELSSELHKFRGY